MSESSQVRIFEHSNGDWWAECLVCAAWVSTSNDTRREAEEVRRRHLQNDHRESRRRLTVRARRGHGRALPGTGEALGEACTTPLTCAFELERVTGIEPALPAWKAGTLPLSYTRVGAEDIGVGEGSAEPMRLCQGARPGATQERR